MGMTRSWHVLQCPSRLDRPGSGVNNEANGCCGAVNYCAGATGIAARGCKGAVCFHSLKRLWGMPTTEAPT